MNLKIEKAFVDKITGARYEAGAVVDFEIRRAEEILADARQLVSKVETKEEPEEIAEPEVKERKRSRKK